MTQVSSGNWEFFVNEQLVTLTAEGLVLLVDTLVLAGWTVQARSDGTTVTSDGSENSAADWDNTDAWTHVRDPGGFRDVSIQRGSTQTARIFQTKRGDPMTGGTPTVAPSATTQVQVLGSSGSYVVFFNFTAASNQIHIGAASVPSGETGDVYPWYFCSRVKSTGNAQGFCAVIPVKTVADGSVGDVDDEPWVAVDGIPTVLVGSGWYKANLAGEAVRENAISASLTAAEQGQNPYSLAFDRPGAFFVDSGGGFEQRKGLAEEDVLTWKGISAHSTYDTYNIATEGNAFVIFDNVAIRWPHNTVPVF